MQSVADAVAGMLAATSGYALGEEIVALQQLDGRILAKPLYAPETVPAFDNSAMDGYALHSRDAELLCSTGLTLAGAALAGHPFRGVLQPGQALRIMTGAEMPAGADTVIMQEDVQVDVQADGERIVSQVPLHPGSHVRHAGEDIRRGEVMLAAGQRLTPLHIGLLASVGLAQAEVFRKLRVALFSSGDELCQPGDSRQAHQIYDSNRFALRAMLERMPIEIIHFAWLPDTLEAMRSAIAAAAQEADVIITSAGVSVGDADYTRQVLDELGEVNFWRVAMKPGKPFAFGRVKNSWFFGLPGNPVSAIVTLDQLAQPVLRQLCGERVQAALPLLATAAEAFRKQPGRQDFQRIRLDSEAGVLTASPCGSQGSGLLHGFANAQGYAVLEAERGHVAPGEQVRVMPLGTLLN
jgi:molybdopterin molybdotransferase